MSIREDVELYTKLSGEDGSQETIATIGAYLRGYRQGCEELRNALIEILEADNDTRMKYFGYICIIDILVHYSAFKIVEKWQARKKDDEINVGDEVDWSGDKFIVTRIFKPYDKAEECDGVDMDGCTYHDVLISGLTKTGRHVDIIDMLKGALK